MLLLRREEGPLPCNQHACSAITSHVISSQLVLVLVLVPRIRIDYCDGSAAMCPRAVGREIDHPALILVASNIGDERASLSPEPKVYVGWT
jgi:hypothetical protein